MQKNVFFVNNVPPAKKNKKKRQPVAEQNKK